MGSARQGSIPGEAQGLTGYLEVWWCLSLGVKSRCRVGLWRGLPVDLALDLLIGQLDTGSVEEERGQNGLIGHYPAFTMLGLWMGVSRLDMNKFKDIQTSTSPR